MEDIARSLIPEYRKVFDSGDGFQGLSIRRHAGRIAQMVVGYKALTLLDYGCGMALAYKLNKEHKRAHKKWGGIMPRLYDPAYEPYSKRPTGKFDGVICCDVLEHVPEEEIPAFLDDVFGYAEKFVFFTVCCRPAKRILPNGLNAHVTVKPYEWWHRQVRKRANGKRFELVESE